MIQETGVVELYHHTSVLKESLSMKSLLLDDSASTERNPRSVRFLIAADSHEIAICLESHT
jgi:hypothetical protein